MRIRGSASTARAMATPLALAARQLDAALPHDRVVAVRELLNELVAVGRCGLTSRISSCAASGFEKPMLAAMVPSNRKFSCRTTPRWARYSFSRSASRSWPSTSTSPDVGRLNAMIRLISVLLPDPLEPTRAVVVPGAAVSDTSPQHRHALLVLELDVLHADLAADRGDRRAGPVFLVLGHHAADLADAVEAGECLGDLGADG